MSSTAALMEFLLDCEHSGSDGFASDPTPTPWTLSPDLIGSTHFGPQSSASDSDYAIADQSRRPSDRSSPDGNDFPAKVSRTLAKIDRRAYELNQAGINDRDIGKIRTRLSFAWSQPCKERQKTLTSVTTWRTASARRAYAQVQELNDHLVLPVILAVTPTECSTPVFKEVLATITQSNKYSSYRLRSTATMQTTLSSIAEDGEFQDSPQYLKFMRALFPQHDFSEHDDNQNTPTQRDIEIMYTAPRTEDLTAFLQTLLAGVTSSEKAIIETTTGSRNSNCATVLVPLNEKDCVCHFVVDRTIAMDAVFRFGLTGTRLACPPPQRQDSAQPTLYQVSSV